MKTQLWLREQKIILPIMIAALLQFPELFCAGCSSFRAMAAAHGATAASMEKGSVELGLWAGGSPVASTLIGKTVNRELLLSGLRYGWVFATSDSIAYEYTFDLIPAAGLFAPARAGSKKSWIYGAGLTPLGLQVHFRRGRPVQPFVSAGVGFLYFEKKVPVPGASRANITPELGLGVRFFLDSGQSLSVGYKYHHLSNAYTARRNPGLDSNVFYVSFSFVTPPP